MKRFKLIDIIIMAKFFEDATNFQSSILEDRFGNEGINATFDSMDDSFSASLETNAVEYETDISGSMRHRIPKTGVYEQSMTSDGGVVHAFTSRNLARNINLLKKLTVHGSLLFNTPAAGQPMRLSDNGYSFWAKASIKRWIGVKVWLLGQFHKETCSCESRNDLLPPQVLADIMVKLTRRAYFGQYVDYKSKSHAFNSVTGLYFKPHKRFHVSGEFTAHRQPYDEEISKNINVKVAQAIPKARLSVATSWSLDLEDKSISTEMAFDKILSNNGRDGIKGKIGQDGDIDVALYGRLNEDISYTICTGGTIQDFSSAKEKTKPYFGLNLNISI